MLEHVERKLFNKSGGPLALTLTLLDGHFSMTVELMVISILQGGPAPNFLHSSVQFVVVSPNYYYHIWVQENNACTTFSCAISPFCSYSSICMLSEGIKIS